VPAKTFALWRLKTPLPKIHRLFAGAGFRRLPYGRKRMDFSSVDRNYAAAREKFHLPLPETLNFAFDVVDDWAARDDRTSVIARHGDDGGAVVARW